MNCPYLKNRQWCTHKKNGHGHKGDKIRCRCEDITDCVFLRETQSEAVNLQLLEKDCLECPKSLTGGLVE